jgi:hypothetical protein
MDYQEKATILPEHMREPMIEYIRVGRPTGGFLTAILENNLISAAAAADQINLWNLHAFANYLYNYAPRGCYGSSEKVHQWIKRGGLEGAKVTSEEK